MRGWPPPKLPLTTVAGLDPITLIYPFVLERVLAMTVPRNAKAQVQSTNSNSLGKLIKGEVVEVKLETCHVHLSYIATVLPDDNHSQALASAY